MENEHYRGMKKKLLNHGLSKSSQTQKYTGITAFMYNSKSGISNSLKDIDQNIWWSLLGRVGGIKRFNGTFQYAGNVLLI